MNRIVENNKIRNKIGEEYFYIQLISDTLQFEICNTRDFNCPKDTARFSSSNYFNTLEQANDKLKSLAEIIDLKSFFKNSEKYK